MRGGAGGDAVGRVLRVSDSVSFLHQVSEAECEGALEETRWDVCCVCLIVCLSSTRCQRQSVRGRWRRRGGMCVACVIVCFSSTRCRRRSARGRWRRRGGTCVACV